MKKTIDLQATLTNDGYIEELVATRDVHYHVALANEELTMEGKWLLVNVILWRPLIARGLPIERRHVAYDVELTNDVIQRIDSEIYRDIILHTQDGQEGVLHEMAERINVLYNVACIHLGSHQRSISMFEIETTLADPVFATASHLNIAKATAMGIHEEERVLKSSSASLLDTLKDPAHKAHNVFYPYVKLGIASKQQVPQVLLAAGTRTDVNDLMILKPVKTSYVRGLNDIHDLAIDSLSAKKSILYNALGLGGSQYVNRKEQLMASMLYKLHKGDCGTTVTLPFEILPINSSHDQCIGKFVVEKNGSITELTHANMQSYVGKIVQLRSPICCLHTDGCCQVCGGRMTDYMHPNVVLGIASTIELMGPTAQLILSNKHVSQTSSIVYRVPDPYSDIYEVMRNEIYLKPNVDRAKIAIGVPFDNVARISDLQFIEEDQAINDQHFSSITQMTVADAESGDIETPITLMTDAHGSIPYFSAEFLTFIKNNPDDVMILPDTVWIKIGKFDPKYPIMRCIVSNDSMMRFSKKIGKLFTDDIKRYKSATEVMRDFTNTVYSKVWPNLFHLEIIIRASLVVSAQDYRIPQVKDPDKVQFASLGHIIPQRSIGGQLAFERTADYLADPRTYTIPKPPGPFDPYAGRSNRP